VVFEGQYEGNYILTRCRQSEQRKPQTEDSSANNFVYAIATLTFSGTYPTGGDTLDFTQMVQVFAESQNGISGYYIPVQGTALNKLEAESVRRRRHGNHRRRVSRQRHRRRRAAQHHLTKITLIVQ
jgi:hypothetical protein